jgi:ureidoglycolate hydrolase
MTPESLTQEAFAPFGTVLAEAGGSPDASGPGWDWWADTGRLAADARPYAVGRLALRGAPPVIDWAERHARSAELVLALDPCLLYVAPPGDAPERFRAFHVPPGQGVVLEPGVWHGAPLSPGGAGAAIVLLPAGAGTDDTDVARFPHNPIRIEV